MILLARAYDEPGASGAPRYLIDRVWPRGIKKEALQLTAWLKDAAPSTGLRKWFRHDAAKWDEFRRRYEQELREHPESWAPILEKAREGDVVLVFAARDVRHSNALALRDFLQHQLEGT